MDENERAAQVELAASGDPDALQRLIVYYHPPLRGTLDRHIDAAVCRYIDPDDVLQETYIAAFKAVGGRVFDGPGAFYKWLETIALNRLKDDQRARRRRKRDIGREVALRPTGTTSYPDLVDRFVSPDSTPSRKVARQEATAAVMSSLARLAEDQREVVRLRFLEDRPVAEVADRLGKTEAAVHMLCHRGLKELRRLLGSITRWLTGL